MNRHIVYRSVGEDASPQQVVQFLRNNNCECLMYVASGHHDLAEWIRLHDGEGKELWVQKSGLASEEVAVILFWERTLWYPTQLCYDVLVEHFGYVNVSEPRISYENDCINVFNADAKSVKELLKVDEAFQVSAYPCRFGAPLLGEGTVIMISNKEYSKFLELYND